MEVCNQICLYYNFSITINKGIDHSVNCETIFFYFIPFVAKISCTVNFASKIEVKELQTVSTFSKCFQPLQDLYIYSGRFVLTNEHHLIKL